MSLQNIDPVVVLRDDWYAIQITVERAPTYTEDYARFVFQLVKDMGDSVLDKLHAAVGIAGEAGELLDAIKKHWAYGKPLDVQNVVEELGDLEFYMCAMRLLIGVSRQEVLQANANKLAVRYAGLQYSDTAAIIRADKVVETESSGIVDGQAMAINIPDPLVEQASMAATAAGFPSAYALANATATATTTTDPASVAADPAAVIPADSGNLPAAPLP